MTEVPNQPATPARAVRVDDELWEDGKRVAADAGDKNMSEYVRRLIREDVRRWPGPKN